MSQDRRIDLPPTTTIYTLLFRWPLILTIKPTPQASFSRSGEYKPTSLGNPLQSVDKAIISSLKITNLVHIFEENTLVHFHIA